jgi:hypothetical protein
MAEHGRTEGASAIHQPAAGAISAGAPDPKPSAARPARPTFWITMSGRICPACRVRYLPLRGLCICVAPPWWAP